MIHPAGAVLGDPPAELAHGHDRDLVEERTEVLRERRERLRHLSQVRRHLAVAGRPEA